MSTAGTRYRIVTVQNGVEHVSSVVIGADEIDEQLAIEADLHECTGWTVDFLIIGGERRMRAYRGNVYRWIYARSFQPMEDMS